MEARIIEKKEKNFLTVIDLMFCVVLSLAFSSSTYYINNGGCEISLAFCATTLYTFMLFLVITYIIRWGMKKQSCYTEKKYVVLESRVNDFMRTKYHVVIISMIILLSWLPVLIILYPGTAINDTWAQLRQFIEFVADGKINRGVLYDHHPVFDTLYMGIVIVPIAKATGKWHLAMFLYVFLQAIFTSFSFAITIEYVYKKLQVGVKVVLAMLVVYCLLPIYPASVQTISKDALFSWIYVLFSILFIELVRSKGECLKNKKYVVGLIGVAVLCCLTKKVGMYVILISLMVCFVFQKKNRKNMLIPIGSIIIIMFIIMPIVKNEFGVVSGGKQEMFSLPFQQTARYVKYHGDDITDGEYKIIDKLLSMENLAERYDPIFADPVKGYSERGTTKDYIDYIIVWINQGIRHPKTYIAAFNAMLSGWFSWCEYKPLMNMGWHNQLIGDMIPEWVSYRGDFFEKTSVEYEKMFDNLYENPFAKILLSYGLYASLIPAFVVGTVCRRRKRKDIKYWIGIVPMILSIVLGCWLSPVSTYGIEGMRYLYPIVYTTPMMIVWCMYIYRRG